MHYETPYVNYTIPGNFFGDVVFKDELSVKPLAPDIPLPSYAHPTDAGLDLHAISVEAPGTVILPPVLSSLV
jgi:dUTPase